MLRFINSLGNRVKYNIRKITSPVFRELEKIKSQERYTEGITGILGATLKFADALSFYYMYDEIFEKQIFNFKTANNKPLIIDAGANIGLATIYFKRLYPEARIIAFEPDNKIYNILDENVSSFQLQNVNIFNYALWNEEGELTFFSEGADGGRITSDVDNPTHIKVKTTRLSQYINEKTELLKIDIEGAEVEVIKEAAHKLHFVNNLFIEFHSFVNKEQELDVLLKILREAGFRYYVQNLFSKNQPFIEKSVNLDMDLQLNIFAFRNR